MAKRNNDFSCPSVQHDTSGATIFGIAEGTPENPMVSYLEKGIKLKSEELNDLEDFL